MERKTKQRILGVFVVIGLIAILLPFFQTNKELPSEKMLVKAPPFPDQATQMAQDGVTPDEIQTPDTQLTSQAATNTNNPPLDDTINVKTSPVANNSTVNSNNAITPEPNKIANENANETNNKITNNQLASSESIQTKENNPSNSESNLQKTSVNPSEQKDNSVKQDNTKTLNRPSLSPEESSEDTEIANKKLNKTNDVISQTKNIEREIKSNSASIKRSQVSQNTNRFVPKVIEYKSLVAPLKSEPITSNGLSQLKNAAWVIQLGSFKSKPNAIQLVNQLRAKGYRAFIQQVSTPVGNTTRVFVGPELKQDHARKTADHIASSMRLHGIVISYKPLAL